LASCIGVRLACGNRQEASETKRFRTENAAIRPLKSPLLSDTIATIELNPESHPRFG